MRRFQIQSPHIYRPHQSSKQIKRIARVHATTTMMMRIRWILSILYILVLVRAEDDAFRYPACSICPGGQEPLLGDLGLPANTAGVLPFSMTCDQAQAMARSGFFSPATCVILRARIFDNCVCRVVSTKAPSVPVPTSFPTSSPTTLAPSTMAPVTLSPSQPIIVGAPSFAPFTWFPTMSPSEAPVVVTPTPTTASPTLKPSPVPTSTNAPVAALVTTTIYLRIDGITGPLDEDEQDAFQRACLIFLADRVPEANNNVVCALSGRRRRRLQSSNDLNVQADVSSQNYSGEDFTQSVLDAFAEYGDEFLDELQDQSDSFDDATGVKASDNPIPTVLEPTPITANPSLSAGGLSALVVGCAVATVVIIAGAYLVSRPAEEPEDHGGRLPSQQSISKNQQNPLQIEVDQGGEAKKDTIMMYPPKHPNGLPEEDVNVPVAAAAAVEAASKLHHDVATTDENESSGDDEDDDSVEASEIEGFSMVEAADVATKSNADSAKDSSSVSSSALSSLRQNMVSRTVVAPPGKLGIVIDTTLEGPVVHKVNPKSPLQGVLFPGDIIVAVDDVDTRAMPASAITALMVRTSGVRRKLTVLSEDTAGA